MKHSLNRYYIKWTIVLMATMLALGTPVVGAIGTLEDALNLQPTDTKFVEYVVPKIFADAFKKIVGTTSYTNIVRDLSVPISVQNTEKLSGKTVDKFLKKPTSGHCSGGKVLTGVGADGTLKCGSKWGIFVKIRVRSGAGTIGEKNAVVGTEYLLTKKTPIQTSGNELEIVFEDDSLIRLSSNTKINLSPVLRENGKKLAKASYDSGGRVWGRVLSDEWPEFENGSAVVGVRWTSLYMDGVNNRIILPQSRNNEAGKLRLGETEISLGKCGSFEAINSSQINQIKTKLTTNTQQVILQNHKKELLGIIKNNNIPSALVFGSDQFSQKVETTPVPINTMTLKFAQQQECIDSSYEDEIRKDADYLNDLYHQALKSQNTSKKSLLQEENAKAMPMFGRRQVGNESICPERGKVWINTYPDSRFSDNEKNIGCNYDLITSIIFGEQDRFFNPTISFIHQKKQWTLSIDDSNKLRDIVKSQQIPADWFLHKVKDEDDQKIRDILSRVTYKDGAWSIKKIKSNSEGEEFIVGGNKIRFIYIKKKNKYTDKYLLQVIDPIYKK